MRTKSLLLVPIAAAFAIAAACSTFSGEPVADPDGGAEAAGSDAAILADGSVGDSSSGADASAADAALPPTPGVVECFDSTCDRTKNESCCSDPDAAAGTHCGTSCAFGTFSFSCDDGADCAPGQSCCIDGFGNVSCQVSCSGERLCHANRDCAEGSLCVDVPCRGKTIGTCGPIGNYVKSYCNIK